MNLRSSSKETFMIVYGSEVFHRGSFTVRDLFSSFTFLSYTFMHSRGPRKQLRDSRKKNGPLFIEFTIFHVSSRRDFYPLRESVRFSKLRLTWYALRFMRISYGTLKWGDGRTLHYNYSIKKFVT